jgi:hypothetical protein
LLSVAGRFSLSLELKYGALKINVVRGRCCGQPVQLLTSVPLQIHEFPSSPQRRHRHHRGSGAYCDAGRAGHSGRVRYLDDGLLGAPTIRVGASVMFAPPVPASPLRQLRQRVRQSSLAARLFGLGLTGFIGLVVLLFTFFGLPDAAVGVLIGVVVIAIALRSPVDKLLPFVVFLAIILDVPAEQPFTGRWSAPWLFLSEFYFDNIRKSAPGSFLPFSPYFLLLVAMAARILSTRVTNPDIYSRPMRRGIALCMTTLVGIVVYSVGTGGNIETCLRQTTGLFAVPIIAFLVMEASKLSETFLERFSKAVIIGASWKALVAIYSYFTVVRPNLGVGYILIDEVIVGPPEYATTHSDSAVWGWALMLIIIRWFDGRWAHRRAVLLTVGPLLAAGIVVNARRVTWVQMMAGGLVILWLSRPAIKKQIGRAITLGSPLIAGYIAVGWSAGASLFAPVQAIKSVFDSSDGSNASRDVENLNLVFTFRLKPFTGWGFGKEYQEIVSAIDLSTVFKEYRFVPHNSLLGMYVFAGPVGFIGFWSIIVIAMTMAIRAYREAPPMAQWPRTLALWSISGLMIYMLQAWADIGLQSVYVAMIAGASCGMAGAAARMVKSNAEINLVAQRQAAEDSSFEQLTEARDQLLGTRPETTL